MNLFINASSLEPDAHNFAQFKQGNVFSMLLLTLNNYLPISASSEVFFFLLVSYFPTQVTLKPKQDTSQYSIDLTCQYGVECTYFLLVCCIHMYPNSSFHCRISRLLYFALGCQKYSNQVLGSYSTQQLNHL